MQPMKYQRIHIKIKYICLVLAPIGFIIGGIREIENNMEKAASYFFFIGSLFMVSHCLNAIEVGRIRLFSYTTILERQREPYMFWAFTGGIIICSVLAAPVMLYRVFA